LNSKKTAWAGHGRSSDLELFTTLLLDRGFGSERASNVAAILLEYEYRAKDQYRHRVRSAQAQLVVVGTAILGAAVPLFQKLLEWGYAPEAWTVVGAAVALLGTLVGRWVSLNRTTEGATVGRHDSPDPSPGGDTDSPSAHAERLATGAEAKRGVAAGAIELL
jgi:hypothetical protein